MIFENKAGLRRFLVVISVFALFAALFLVGLTNYVKGGHDESRLEREQLMDELNQSGYLWLVNSPIKDLLEGLR